MNSNLTFKRIDAYISQRDAHGSAAVVVLLLFSQQTAVFICVCAVMIMGEGHSDVLTHMHEQRPRKT